MRLDVSNPRHDTTPCVSFAPRMWNETFVQHAFVRRHSFAQAMPRFRFGFVFRSTSPGLRFAHATCGSYVFYSSIVFSHGSIHRHVGLLGCAWMRLSPSTFHLVHVM